MRLPIVHRGRQGALTTTLAAAVLLAATPAAAQSVGLEAGLAGIENYDAFTPAFGASLRVPVWKRLGVSASYTRWTGRDGNEVYFGAGGPMRLGYGNQALVVTGLFRAVGAEEGLSASVGGGLGWFQHFEDEGGRSVARYDRTPMGSLLVRYPAGRRVAPYLRADVQIPDGGYLRYGLVRLGVDLALR